MKKIIFTCLSMIFLASANSFAVEPAQETVYKNTNPPFTLRIPKNARKNWYFKTIKNPAAPFFILVNDIGLNKNMPSISSLIKRIPDEIAKRDKTEFFKEIAAENEKWEKEALGPNAKTINKGNAIIIGDGEFQAFQRLIQNSSGGKTYHIVYIFLDKYFLQLTMNADTPNFLEYDSDFVAILNTLTTN